MLGYVSLPQPLLCWRRMFNKIPLILHILERQQSITCMNQSSGYFIQNMFVAVKYWKGLCSKLAPTVG